MQEKILLSLREQKYAASNQLVSDFHITLKDNVDPVILEKAVHAALAFHPLFRTRIIREKNGLFYYKYNEALPKIIEQIPAHTIYYGTEELGFFPWQITCSGTDIRISGSHAVSDGMGYTSFIKAILHLYFAFQGHVFSPEADTDLTPSTDPAFNPFSAVAQLPCHSPGIPSFSPGAAASEDFFETDLSKLQPRKIILQKQDIGRLARKREVSSFSIISCFAARAVQMALQVEHGNIKVRVPINLRSCFSCETDRNFSVGFPLNYDVDKLSGKSSSLVATVFRSQLDLMSDRDNLIRKLREEEILMDKLRKAPGKLDGMRDAFREKRRMPATDISYTHITHAGFSSELEELIDGYELSLPLMPEKTMVIWATTFKDKITLNIYETLKGNALSKAMEKLILEENISCRCENTVDYPLLEYISDQF